MPISVPDNIPLQNPKNSKNPKNPKNPKSPKNPKNPKNPKHPRNPKNRFWIFKNNVLIKLANHLTPFI